jgi:hypothetical protein
VAVCWLFSQDARLAASGGSVEPARVRVALARARATPHAAGHVTPRPARRPPATPHHTPQARPDNNSVIAFNDNSSAIRGFKVKPMLPLNPGGPSALGPQQRDWDLLLTAETHNFPCAVAPYPGARGACVCGGGGGAACGCSCPRAGLLSACVCCACCVLCGCVLWIVAAAVPSRVYLGGWMRPLLPLGAVAAAA